MFTVEDLPEEFVLWVGGGGNGNGDADGGVCLEGDWAEGKRNLRRLNVWLRRGVCWRVSYG